MILSQITVSLQGDAGKRLVRSAHLLHRMVYRNFPGDERVLFRVEPYGEADCATVLIQHNQPPPQTWSNFGAYFLGQPRHRVLEPALDGARYLFRLAAAPTMSISPDDKATRGRVIDVLDTEKQLAWLRRKLGAAADIEEADVLFSRLRYVQKPTMKKYRFRECLFQGVLVCRDAEVLTTLRDQGIGRHKSLGSGLLSLVRIS